MVLLKKQVAIMAMVIVIMDTLTPIKNNVNAGGPALIQLESRKDESLYCYTYI